MTRIVVHEEEEILKDEYAQEYKALQDQNQGYQHQHLEKKKQKVNYFYCVILSCLHNMKWTRNSHFVKDKLKFSQLIG